MRPYLLLLISLSAACATAFAADAAPPPTRYLALQLFTGTRESPELQQNFPPSPQDLRQTVAELRDRVGLQGSPGRKLAFVVGPLSFDHTDDQVRARIASAFDVALETGVAVGFHVDDSMFWGRLKELSTVENVEWLDWSRTPNTGRRLDWSATPKKIMPQLCINSAAVTAAVAKRAALIGAEVAKGVRKLAAAGQSDLFLGVIAGWETQIGSDFDTRKYPGYCALTNAGFTAAKPPADPDAELSKIVREFAGFWARSLVESGVPKGKAYSHIAFKSTVAYSISSRMDPAVSSVPYLKLIHWTPSETAFCDLCVPGFSTYPQPGQLEQWREELQRHSDPAWASSEGTSLDPGEAGRSSGMDMERYLGNLFNHGAILVNVFGWGVGDSDNAFRKVAEGQSALAAYRKFLRGETLAEAPLPIPQIPPADLPAKIHTIQSALPEWIEAHGAERIKPLMENLAAAMNDHRFEDAAKQADAILKLLAE
jgi:hypothetical protein